MTKPPSGSGAKRKGGKPSFPYAEAMSFIKDQFHYEGKALNNLPIESSSSGASSSMPMPDDEQDTPAPAKRGRRAVDEDIKSANMMMAEVLKQISQPSTEEESASAAYFRSLQLEFETLPKKNQLLLRIDIDALFNNVRLQLVENM